MCSMRSYEVGDRRHSCYVKLDMDQPMGQLGLTHGLGWVGSSSFKYELLPNSTGKYYFQSRILLRCRTRDCVSL